MLGSDSQNEKLVSPEKPYVLPDQVEEEAHIAHIDFYKAPRSKVILFGFLTLITAGLVALLAKWKNSVLILLMYVRSTPAEAEHLLVRGMDGTSDLVDITNKELNLDGSRRIYKSFVYRLYTYYFDTVDNLYRPIQYTIKDQTYEDIHRQKGNSFEAYQKNLLNYGENSTNVPRKGNFQILVDEVLSPFYIFQIFAVILWGFFEDYVVYSAFIFVMSVITLTFGFLKIRSNHQKLQEKAFYETEIKLFSKFSLNGDKYTPEQRVIRSNLLVPGDLIEIPNNKKMPCDVILLSGTCVMNESMLTGESVPVIKQQLPATNKIFNAASADQYILYSGTECLETRNIDPNAPVLGVVFGTGFATMKGRLVRSFLYSKPENFKFYRDSLKYIAAMSILAMICFAFTVHSLIQQGQDVGVIIAKSLDIITIAVPPALPTCVAIGASIASARLEQKKIITKSELKINVAGKVEFMCFDKTGTLTRDSLDLHGVRAVGRGESNSIQFQALAIDNIHRSLNYSDSKTLSHKMLELMSSCHSLTFVRNAISGDPLDMKMFEATGWQLTESNRALTSNSNQEARLCTLNPPVLGESAYYTSSSQVIVLKRFEFSPKLQRMSVITKDQTERRQRIYVKGSPEMIATLCKQNTLPQDFSKVLLSYTQSGLRVIACATKVLEEEIGINDELNRENFENELEFLGFLIFENKMKEITPSIISKLKFANINTIMLTGDNPLTAIFVARGCGIVDKDQKVILGTIKPTENESGPKEIEWKVIEGIKIESETETDSSSVQLRANNQFSIEMSERPLASPIIQPEEREVQKDTNYDIPIPQKDLPMLLEQENNIAIAMTGDAFNYFDSNADNDPSLRQLVLKKAKVLARMRPDDKAFVVDKLQNQGYIVGMCGDGANDCPALKVANVGVSLSESEASLAAPFMSKITNISCIDILLREGRTALVTSFQCFKFMSMYSLIQTVTVVILYTRVSSMTDPCFLYQDLILIIPAAFTMALTHPTNKLSKQQPTGSLLSPTVLISILGQCVIQATAQYLSLLLLWGESWYQTPTELYDISLAETGDEEAVVPDYDATMLFHVGNMQYLATVVAFSIGRPFRKPFYTNFYFTLSLAVTVLLSVLVVLIPMPGLMNLLQIKGFDGNEGFRFEILAFIAGNAVTTFAYEKFAVPFLCNIWRNTFQKIKRS